MCTCLMPLPHPSCSHCSTARELLCDVFVPVLRTVLLAPPSSPLSTINANNIVDLLVHLTTVKGEGQVNGAVWGCVDGDLMSVRKMCSSHCTYVHTCCLGMYVRTYVCTMFVNCYFFLCLLPDSCRPARHLGCVCCKRGSEDCC